MELTTHLTLFQDIFYLHFLYSSVDPAEYLSEREKSLLTDVRSEETHDLNAMQHKHKEAAWYMKKRREDSVESGERGGEDQAMLPNVPAPHLL